MVGIFQGSTEIVGGKLNIGSAEVKEVYHGVNKIWPLDETLGIRGAAEYNGNLSNIQRILVPSEAKVGDFLIAQSCRDGNGPNGAAANGWVQINASRQGWSKDSGHEWQLMKKICTQSDIGATQDFVHNDGLERCASVCYAIKGHTFDINTSIYGGIQYASSDRTPTAPAQTNANSPDEVLYVGFYTVTNATLQYYPSFLTENRLQSNFQIGSDYVTAAGATLLTTANAPATQWTGTSGTGSSATIVQMF